MTQTQATVSQNEMADIPLDLPRAPVGPCKIEDLQEWVENPNPLTEARAIAFLRHCGAVTIRSHHGNGPNHHYRLNEAGKIESIPVLVLKRYGVAETAD
jgi:hypothetical protein